MACSLQEKQIATAMKSTNEDSDFSIKRSIEWGIELVGVGDWNGLFYIYNLMIVFLFILCSIETTNHDTSKPNGKLEDAEDVVSSPPRTTLLGTIFSPVFNFFSPATNNGEMKNTQLNSNDMNDHFK